MGNTRPRSRWCRLALGAALGLGYLGLAALLDATPVPPSGTTAPAATHDHAHAKGEAETPGHVCGLEAKAMLEQFQAAIAGTRGAVHPTTAWGDQGLLAVRDQLVVGLTPEGFAGLDALAAARGLRVVRALPSVGIASLGCPAGFDPASLAAAPGVRYVEPNLAARVSLRPNDPFHELADGARLSNLEGAWDLSTGAGVIVALLDTGVSPNHPDLAGRLLPGFDVVNNSTTMSDDNGHGTAMAGLIAATGQNGAGVVGVAFGAQLLPIKVADAMGVASVADVAAGIDLAIQRGARIINLSLGTPVGSQALLDAVNRALAAGVVVVASAGNDPVHHEQFPAAYPGVVSATVLSPKGELGCEAVVAEGVDVGCPVEEVISTLPGDVYGFVGGTSAASAFASGVAALVIARHPNLTGAQVAQVLRASQARIPALAGLEHVYRFGRLDALAAVQASDPLTVDLAITRLELLPRRPRPGTTATAVVEVENQGFVAVSGAPVRVQRRDPATGQLIELGVVGATLQPGQRQAYRVTFTTPAAGSHALIAVANARQGEVDLADNTRDLTAVVAAAGETNVRMVARALTTPDLATGRVSCTVTLENSGTETVRNLVVTGSVQPVRSRASLSPSSVALAAPTTALTPRTVVSLEPGAQLMLPFVWSVPTPAPVGVVRMTIAAQQATNEVDVSDNTVYADLLLGRAGALSSLYQQSNDVDVIPDAPFRVDPNRGYVPVSIFVPSKGGSTSATVLRVTRTELLVRDTPTGTPTTLYDDPAGAPPTTSPAGLELVDELGAVRTGATARDIFDDVELDVNGRHDILRLPRAALGVALQPAAPVDKYLDVKVSWEQRRVLFFWFTQTRAGSHRSVLKVRFSPAGLPSTPGENHYHDVHHHTIAEWYFGSPLDLFAPRKAYGGPLQMVLESTYAMGLIAAPTLQAARGRIITTDHSSFNNRTIPDPDGPDHRPPFGPQSPTLNPGVGQLEAYRNVFGLTAGEEVAFKQDVPYPRINIPFVNQILNVLPGVPIGAHMLLYHANHVEGPWHGGGFLKGPGNPNIDVNLFPLLNDAAKNDQGRQGSSFAYAAHPFGGQGWNDGNLERGYGLDPANRTKDELHDGSREFVVKGLEFFNGRGTRSLATAKIDFNDLNPWADADFARGAATWDSGLWSGMTRWHEMLSKTLEYSFTAAPETRFIRKIYQAGGSDAHGDFNFSVGRAATPLAVQQTYSVGDETYYGVRTYCLGDGKPGATPEERWMAAYADGNTVTTDGPLLTLSLDADRRWDGKNRRWHDATLAAEDDDGRMGGDGPLDGGFTALVRRGSDAPAFRYRYSSTPEYGPVASLLLYKTEAGAPNPTRSHHGHDQIVGVNRLAMTGPDQDLAQPLDTTKEGPVTKVTAFAAGAYTVGDPDQVDLGPDSYRCYTNPVFCVPYDVDITVGPIDPATSTIPAGALQVRFTFDVSMEPTAPAIEVEGLDATGSSTGLAASSLGSLVPASGTGWSDRPGIASSVLTVTNASPIVVTSVEYPAAGKSTFVVFFRDAPKDAAGNALNPIAATFETPSGTAAPGTVTPPLTNGGGAVAGGGGGGSGSGCALTPVSTTSAGAPALLGLVLAALLARRRRHA